MGLCSKQENPTDASNLSSRNTHIQEIHIHEIHERILGLAMAGKASFRLSSVFRAMASEATAV